MKRLSLAVVLGVAVLLLGRFGAIEAASGRIDDRTYSTALSASAVDMKAAANDERGFLLTGDASFREEIGKRADKIRDELTTARETAPEADDVTFVAESNVGEVAGVAEPSSASAEQVSASTQQTSASAQEIAASAQSLAGTAAELDQLVRRFTVAPA